MVCGKGCSTFPSLSQRTPVSTHSRSLSPRSAGGKERGEKDAVKMPSGKPEATKLFPLSGVPRTTEASISTFSRKLTAVSQACDFLLRIWDCIS